MALGNNLMGFAGAMKGLFGRKSRRQGVAPVELASKNDVVREGPANAANAAAAAARAAPALPRFQATATDQLDRKRVDRFSGVRMKLRNAFTPSQPVIDRQMFSGRSEVLTSMIRSIEDQRLHLVVYGERGIGKTSLMHILADAARDARYIVFYSSCGTTSEFEETFRAAAEDIPVLFHSGFAPTTSDAERGDSLANLLPPGRFSPRQFADVCAKLTGTRVLIILDEFDRAASMTFRRDVSELMKFLSDRSVRVQLVIAGVAADLAELLEHAPSVRRNLLAMRVPLMSDAEVQAMVANGERSSGLTFERGARDLISVIAHGSPYLASLICHHSGVIAIENGRLSVGASDVIGGLDQGVEEIEARLGRQAIKEVERLADEGEIPHLAAIAGVALKVGGDFNFGDLRAEMPEAELADVKRLVEKLVKDKVILQDVADSYRQGYAFVEEGVRQYLWFLGVRRQIGANAVRSSGQANRA